MSEKVKITVSTSGIDDLRKRIDAFADFVGKNPDHSLSRRASSFGDIEFGRDFRTDIAKKNGVFCVNIVAVGEFGDLLSEFEATQ